MTHVPGGGETLKDTKDGAIKSPVTATHTHRACGIKPAPPRVFTRSSQALKVDVFPACLMGTTSLTSTELRVLGRPPPPRTLMGTWKSLAIAVGQLACSLEGVTPTNTTLTWEGAQTGTGPCSLDPLPPSHAGLGITWSFCLQILEF